MSFLPDGLGITEGGMVGLYVALGVPPATAVLVVVAYRGLSFWLPTLIGFAARGIAPAREGPVSLSGRSRSLARRLGMTTVHAQPAVSA